MLFARSGNLIFIVIFDSYYIFGFYDIYIINSLGARHYKIDNLSSRILEQIWTDKVNIVSSAAKRTEIEGAVNLVI